MKTAFITFGCSWTYGVGCHYEPGMSDDDLKKHAWDNNTTEQYSFRSILARKYNLTNVNFSQGGSSNQRQFRLAREYFMSNEFEQLSATHDNIVVLWGITSTARYELYSIELKEYVSFLLHQPTFQIDWPFNRLLLEHCYDHDVVVKETELEMRYWNEFFKNRDIKNVWFDTFNNHEYKHIDNLLFASEPEHDLLTILAKNEGLDSNDKKYHYSVWKKDTNRVEYLVNKELLNPYTYHPSKACHEKISDILSPAIERLIGKS